METELALNITVRDYRKMVMECDRQRIAFLIQKRLLERYILPIKSAPASQKHGFCTMAICCLLIEAYQSFREGLGSSEGGCWQAFNNFFEGESRFQEFRPHRRDFYESVRCAILHQAETRNKWKIHRKGPLFEPVSKTINATKFMACLEQSIIAYCYELAEAEWESELWGKALRKLDSICAGCKVPVPVIYFAYGSNMNLDKLNRRARSAVPLGAAKTLDWSVAFNKAGKDKTGKANLVATPGGLVWGVLFQMSEEDLKNLDQREGPGYERRELPVFDSKENQLKAWAYFAIDCKEGLRPDKAYLKEILSGARENGLPDDYITTISEAANKPSSRQERSD